MKKSNKKGFTLVELLVVIAIIAILAAVAVPTAISIVDKGHKSNFEATRDGIVSNVKMLAQASAGEAITAADVIESIKLDKPNDYIAKVQIMSDNTNTYLFFTSIAKGGSTNGKYVTTDAKETFVTISNVVGNFGDTGFNGVTIQTTGLAAGTTAFIATNPQTNLKLTVDTGVNVGLEVDAG